MLKSAKYLEMVEEDPKRAQEIGSNFLRMKLREDGITRKIVPPETVTDADLVPQIDSEDPVLIRSLEAESKGSYIIPFGTLPQSSIIQGRKVKVVFNRMATTEFKKDVDQLRTYQYDIRQVISDNSLKDLLKFEDVTFFNSVDTICGTKDVATATGYVQYKGLSGGITRSTIAEALKMHHNLNLVPQTVVANVNFARDIEKLPWTDLGGVAEETWKAGLTSRNFMGVNWIFTIKRDVVADGMMYMFTAPKFLGWFYVLVDTTLVIEKIKGIMISFYAYETVGMTIGNVGSCMKAIIS